LLGLIFVGCAYPMMMGFVRWDPNILLAISIFAAVSGFSAWLSVKLVGR